MAFDKLIVSRIVEASKNSSKINSSVDALTKKSINDMVLPLEEKSFLVLPFNIKDVLEDKEPLPELTPELISQIPLITLSQKNELNELITKLIADLNKNIISKNQLQISLSTITSSLNPLLKLSKILSAAVKGLKIGINLVPLAPALQSVPPNIPASAIILLCSGLDSLKDSLEKTEGPLKTVPPSIDEITSTLGPLRTKLKNLDKIFENSIKIIGFIKSFLDGSDILQTLNELSSNIQESLTISDEEPINSSQLEFNSNEPLFYRGFKLEIESDPENKFSFSSRRAKGINEQKIILFNTNDGSYSFSSSPQVLIEELKFNIDRYLDN
jgi:hypothetical protein